MRDVCASSGESLILEDRRRLLPLAFAGWQLDAGTRHRALVSGRAGLCPRGPTRRPPLFAFAQEKVIGIKKLVGTLGIFLGIFYQGPTRRNLRLAAEDRERALPVRSSSARLGSAGARAGWPGHSHRTQGVRPPGRATAQLIDAASGVHVWAERYDRTIEDVFEPQDELTGQIVRHLQPELTAAEIARSQRKDERDLGSWDMYLQACAWSPATRSWSSASRRVDFGALPCHSASHIAWSAPAIDCEQLSRGCRHVHRSACPCSPFDETVLAFCKQGARIADR